MFIVSPKILRQLALFSWYSGSLVLLLKGGSLLLEAHTIKPHLYWPVIAIIAGVSIGIIKAIYIFNQSCRNNLLRINSLHEPRLWQFFRPGFFVSLLGMILLGATLSRLAHGNYPMLISVGIIDLSIGTALLVSSQVFWNNKNHT